MQNTTSPDSFDSEDANAAAAWLRSYTVSVAFCKALCDIALKKCKINKSKSVKRKSRLSAFSSSKKDSCGHEWCQEEQMISVLPSVYCKKSLKRVFVFYLTIWWPLTVNSRPQRLKRFAVEHLSAFDCRQPDVFKKLMWKIPDQKHPAQSEPSMCSSTSIWKGSGVTHLFAASITDS